MDFDGYSVGGTSVGEDKPTMYRMVNYATKYLPKDKVNIVKKLSELSINDIDKTIQIVNKLSFFSVI